MEEICIRCNRPRLNHKDSWHPFLRDIPEGSYIRVVHSGYGCDTGCCGHYWQIRDTEGNEILEGEFDFSHPYGSSYREFAETLAGEMMSKYHLSLDMECSEIVDD